MMPINYIYLSGIVAIDLRVNAERMLWRKTRAKNEEGANR